MTAVERETKLVLSSGDYRRLLDAGNLVECSDQLNVYYHDPGRLADAEGYLRVRFTAGKEPMVTLKVPLGWSGDLREMMEVERSLREMGKAFFPRPRRCLLVATDLPDEFAAPFVAAGITELWRLGWMRNHRCLLDFPPDGTVELDRTVLPDGVVVHEVEIESDREAAHEALVVQIRRHAPSARSTQVGKFTRFLQARQLRT
jgi:hypothetical protein